MKKKSLLLILLMALFAPLAMIAQQSIPYNEGFEGMSSADDVTAAGWTLSTTESGTFLAIETTASNVYAGSKSLNLDAWDASSSSSVQYLGLPLMAGNLNTMQISFAYKVSGGSIDVGYLTDADDFSTFTSLANYSSTSSFAVKTVGLSEVPATAARLAIKYTGWFRCYLDAFEVNLLPSCEAATSITASNITATSATITWEGEVGEYWNLDYNGTVVSNISAMTYNLTDLTEGTTYTVKVQNVCDNGSTTEWTSTTFSTPEVCPENTVCIGEGTATSNYLPGNMYYYNSLTEQIYTAEELGEAGNILSIAFYSVQDQTKSHTFDIYMVATEKEAFESTTDWIAVTSGDLVASATITPTAGWNTFELDNTFEYNGSSNVAVIVDVTATSYENGMNFYVYDAPTASQAIRVYSDGTNYDPTNPSSYTGTLMNVKNRLRLLMGEPPACGKPTGLAVNYEGGTTATATWNAVDGAISYGISINGVETTGLSTTSFNLTELDLATIYEVKVNATCESGTGDWSTATEFVTDLCMPEDMCQITFELEDSYGDGWNEAYLLAYDLFDPDEGTIVLLDAFTVPSGESSATYTLNVCDGRDVIFLWQSGNYDSECSYTVYDPQGDKIFSGSGGFDDEDYEYYFVTCNTDCRAPSDFTASNIGGHEVTLSWTENGPATEWTIYYMASTDEEVSSVVVTTNPYTFEGLDPLTTYYAQVVPTCDVDKPSDVIHWTMDEACPKPHITVDPVLPTSATVSWTGFADNYSFEWAVGPDAEEKDPYVDGNWYYYDNGTYAGSVGLGGGEFHWGVMFPAGTYDGSLVSSVKAYDINAMVGTLAIYNDGDTAPSNQISIQDIEFTGANAWVEFPTEATIDPTKNLWIVFDAVDGAAYPMGTCSDDNGDANGRWVEINGTWYDMGNVGVSGRANMVRAYIETGVDPDELDWQPITGATSPVTLDNLTEDKDYYVRIKSICGGEDGESEWQMTHFHTPTRCATPSDLNAEPAARTADLSWTGYTDSYNVRYRVAEYIDASFSDNFDEKNMDQWTTIDADGDGFAWVLGSACGGIYLAEGGSLEGNGHNSSTDLVVSGSFTNVDQDGDGYGDALTPDNYLVSPQLPLGGTFEFWACAQDANYPAEVFGVAVSTTGNTSASDFTTIQQWTMTAKQGGWYNYRVDLSEYEGNDGYIAIRHFDCTDQFLLDVDDIAFGALIPTGEWVNAVVTGNSCTISGLEPKTPYEWQVQGISCSASDNTEWSDIETFTTTEETTVNETITLVSGFNWITICVDITLQELEDAIVAALPGVSGIQIISQNDGFTTYNGRMWRGGLTSIDITKMYRIKLPDGTMCEIVLTGMPVDPAANPLTISPGINWIVFPLNSSMSVADAFAGYNAISGDKLSSQDGYTTFNGRMWRGSLTTLEPGHGYIYNSKATTDQPLVYPTGSKKAAAAPTTTSSSVTINKSVRANQSITSELDLIAPANDINQIFNQVLRQNRLNVNIKK